VLDDIFGRQFLAVVRQQSDDLMTLPDWSSIAQLRDFLLRPPIHPRVLKDTPRFAAITLVAPIVRFNALAIFVAPCLSLAIGFQ